MKKMMKYLKPYRFQCTIGPICKLAEAILELLLPTIMAFVIDEGVVKNNTNLVFYLGGFMIIMVFIGFGCSIVCQYNAAKASQGFGTDLRNTMFQHINKFSYADIDHFTPSSLTNRLTNDINQLQVAVAMLIRLVIRSPFICIGAILMAMLLDFKLSLILLATMPFIAGILYVFIFKTTSLFKVYQKKLDQFANLLDDNFAGIRVIRAFVKQQQEKARVYEACDELQLQMMRISKLSALLNPLNAIVVNSAIVVLMAFGVFQIEAGTIAPGVIIAFINYATQILIAMIAISNLVVIFTKASASMQRVNEVLDYQPSMKEGIHSFNNYANIALDCHDVTFTYGNGAPALSNINFQIHHGETIGVIGGTGSGKSTLAHLLTRFYDPTLGSITMFEHDLKDYCANSLHARITLVPQTNEIFHKTIRDNLVLGEAIKDEDIWKALEDAQAKEFVESLANGLDTILERGGTNLSGGQRQRLCIARALVRKQDILILDDATSALDFRTESLLRKALFKKEKCTCIMISQRASSLIACDRIMVLDNGSLVGFATHQELLKTCAVYQEICETQNVGGELHDNI